MRLYILSLRGLIALALVVSLIEANNFSGVEAKKEVEKNDDGDSGSISEKQPSEQTTKSPKGSSEEESPKPDEKKSDEAEDEGSRSAAAAAAASAVASAAASASASASASADASVGAAASASASAVAEAPEPIDVGASSSSSSSSSSAAAIVETEEITEVTTTQSRSGLKEASSDKKDKESSDKESDDEDSDEEGGKSRSASETVDKDKDAEDGSRSGLWPDFIAKAASGFGMNLFQNVTPRNNTIVLSMKSNFSTGTSSAEATIGPALILNRNGTKMISEGGTVKPMTDDKKAKELVDKAKKDPKSFKLETFQSVSEYNETVVQGKGGITSSTHRDLLISGGSTTMAPASTVKPVSPTMGPVPPVPPVSPVSPVPVSTTMKPVAPTTTAAASTTKKPEPAPASRAPSTVAPSLKPPVCPSCAPCPTGAANVGLKQNGCGGSQVLSGFQASDKLLAIAVTNKGYFKGRRINAKAIETIMKGKLNATPTQIEQGITISPNNSFVFPAGHYYFPHPVRVAGFQSP